jgi:hypothetical protein
MLKGEQCFRLVLNATLSTLFHLTPRSIFMPLPHGCSGDDHQLGRPDHAVDIQTRAIRADTSLQVRWIPELINWIIFIRYGITASDVPRSQRLNKAAGGEIGGLRV